MRNPAYAVLAAIMIPTCASPEDQKVWSRYDWDRPDPHAGGYYADSYHREGANYSVSLLGANERVYRGLFPRSERPPAGGDMDGNPVPGIALRQRSSPILRTLPLMDDGNHRPWHAGFSRDRLVSGFGVWGDQVARNGRKISHQPGSSPAFRVRRGEGVKVGHACSLVGCGAKPAA